MTTDHTKACADQVLELGQRWAAAERAGDADALAPLLADDFLLVGPLGFMLDKTQYLGSRRSGDLRHESLEWADVRVRTYGEAAVAVGTQAQRSTFQGDDASGRFRVTQVLVRRGDHWTVVGLHYSPIAPPHETTVTR
jgi:ketosteroid isomerase-like protein